MCGGSALIISTNRLSYATRTHYTLGFSMPHCLHYFADNPTPCLMPKRGE